MHQTYGIIYRTLSVLLTFNDQNQGMTSFFYVEDGPVPLDAKPAGAGTWGAIVGMTAGLLLVSGLTIRATHKADDDY